MYRPNTLMRAAVIAAAGSLVLAGCGGSDGGNSGNQHQEVQRSAAVLRGR